MHHEDVFLYFPSKTCMSSATKIKTAYTLYNKAELIRGGRSYFSTLHDMIDNARKSIQLQVYIFDEDDTGKEVAFRLIKAARRGVKVQILLDGYASKGLSTGFKSSMRDNGIISADDFTTRLLFVMAWFHSLVVSILLTGTMTCREHRLGWIGRSKWRERPLLNCSNYAINALPLKLKIG